MLDDTKYCPMCEEAGKQLEAAKQRELELLAVIKELREAIQQMLDAQRLSTKYAPDNVEEAEKQLDRIRKAGVAAREALANSEHHDSRALREHEAKVIAEYKQRAEAAEAKLRELDMQENVPEEAYCAAGVEPCACAVANNLDAARYRALRNQDIESDFPRSGVFIGRIPDNKCLTGIDADHAVDALFTAPKQEEK